ncbi:WD repeat-containing protein 76 [Sorex araneus]|uniref:WD repeat-containing protein 76 n=1 Tax=Sorex araneus TaxID=42254 RepID=UPI002433B545|nr:WD repeat-containing protein 76 [Sorex araneus]
MSESVVASEKAGSSKRLQVEVNEYKENQDITFLSLRPEQPTALGKVTKVCLMPFSLSNYNPGQFKCSKSLLDKSSNKVAPKNLFKKTKIKRTCQRILTSEMEATISKAEFTVQKSSLDVPTESYKVPLDTAILSVDKENSQDGDSDEDITSGLDDFSGLSSYEKKRLKNISENAKFFASLQLSESASRLLGMIKKRPLPESKRKKPKKQENEIICRRSMRLLKVEPLEISLPATPVAEENPSLPPGPIEMSLENSELFKGFLHIWEEVNKTRSKSTEKESSSIKSYKANLNGMVLREDTICKVTNSPTCSMAIHPSETRTLMAAGFRNGQVGLWHLEPKKDGVYVFQPHSQKVNSIYFSPANPAHLLSLSYDGTLRCGDFSRAVFEEVYRDERNSFSSFDFLTENASTLIVGHWDGRLSLVDRRTPGTSYEKLFSTSLGKIRTVHVHPIHREYFIATGWSGINIYDARYLHSERSQPLTSLTGHKKSPSSAYFSPLTGNRVVTTCVDCSLRIFDSSCISSRIPLLTTIRPHMITKRWLIRFQAVWDPKQEDCIIVGNMAYPRRVEIFHETGELVHAFTDKLLASVCSVIVMHPTQYILAGGNASGRIHIFMK